MTKKIRPTYLCAAALVAAAPAAAQLQAPAQAASAAAPAYRSAFQGYRPFEAGDVQDWRKANQAVLDAGGWRAYAREIQGGSKGAAPAAGTATAQPASAARPAHSHGGHHP